MCRSFKQLLLLLPFLFTYSASAQLTLHAPANSESPTNLARTILNIFSSCQLVIVKNIYSKGLPRVGEAIAHESSEQVIILDTLLYLKPQIQIEYIHHHDKTQIIKFTYNVTHFKYQRTKKRIFFCFLHPDQELSEALLTQPVFYKFQTQRATRGGFGIPSGYCRLYF